MQLSILSSKIQDLQHWGVKHKIESVIETKASLSTSFLILELFEHIFLHIKGPLLGLYFNTDKCRPED